MDSLIQKVMVRWKSWKMSEIDLEIENLRGEIAALSARLGEMVRERQQLDREIEA